METVENSARALVAEIAAALDDGDSETAADLAARGLAVFPDAAVFHRLRGIALFALGANEEAKDDLNAALVVDPLDNAAIITLARVADMEDDPYTAAEHLLTAWEHDPANPSLRADLTERLAALYGPEGYLQFTRPALAALYVRNVYPERAAREYAAILAEHPNRTDLRLASALAEWRLGRLPETVERCSALLREQPTVVRARWALADALARLGNGEVAREHAKQAAVYDPDGAIARTLIAYNPDAAIVDPDEPLRALPAIGEHIPEGVIVLPIVAEREKAALTLVVTTPPHDADEIAPVVREIFLPDDEDEILPLPLPPEEGGDGGAHSRAPGFSSPIAEVEPSGDPIAAPPAPSVVGDAARAIGEMRAALVAAGSDQEQVRALLPGIRALVDATPERPDARRLLGDAYRKLGQYAQAQGQYRQALLVRVAGKEAGGIPRM